MPDDKRIQKRRTISFAPEVYEVIAEQAAAAKKSISHFVIDKLGEAGMVLPETTHMEYEATRKAIRSREANRARDAMPDDTTAR